MRILTALLAVFLLLLLAPQALGKKVLPHKRGGQKASAGVSVSAKLRSDRRALVVSFANIQTAQSVSYTLLYKTNGQDEGAVGSVSPSEGNRATRELLFGTCSKNVCRYHPNITNAKFEVVAKLKSGKTQTRRYRIRI